MTTGAYYLGLSNCVSHVCLLNKLIIVYIHAYCTLSVVATFDNVPTNDLNVQANDFL